MYDNILKLKFEIRTIIYILKKVINKKFLFEFIIVNKI